MKNRNIPYYVAALMLAAGVSTSFVSCVDTDEPSSIEELRKAKANEVNAQAAYKNALAQTQLQTAEIEKQKAAQEAIATQMKEIDRQIKESSAAVTKAANELAVLKTETEKAVEKVRAGKELNKEQINAIYIANKYEAEVAAKEDSLKYLKDKYAAELASSYAKLNRQIEQTKVDLKALEKDMAIRAAQQTDSVLIAAATTDEIAKNLLTAKTNAEGLLTATFDAWVQAKFNVVKAQATLAEEKYKAAVSTAKDTISLSLAEATAEAQGGVEAQKLAVTAAEDNLKKLQDLKDKTDYQSWLKAYNDADNYIKVDITNKDIKRQETLAEKKNLETVAKNDLQKAEDAYKAYTDPFQKKLEDYDAKSAFYKYDISAADYATLVSYITDKKGNWKGKITDGYDIDQAKEKSTEEKPLNFIYDAASKQFVSTKQEITNANFKTAIAELYAVSETDPENQELISGVIGQFIAKTKADKNSKKTAEETLKDQEKNIFRSENVKSDFVPTDDRALVYIWTKAKDAYNTAFANLKTAKSNYHAALKSLDAADKALKKANEDYSANPTADNLTIKNNAQTTYDNANTAFNGGADKDKDPGAKLTLLGDGSEKRPGAIKNYNTARDKFANACAALFGDNYGKEANKFSKTLVTEKDLDDIDHNGIALDQAVDGQTAKNIKTDRFVFDLPDRLTADALSTILDGKTLSDYEADIYGTKDNEAGKFGIANSVYVKYLRQKNIVVPEWTNKIKADEEAAKFVTTVKSHVNVADAATAELSIVETLKQLVTDRAKLQTAVYEARYTEEGKKLLAEVESKKAAKAAAADSVAKYSVYKDENRTPVLEPKAIIDQAIQEEKAAKENLKTLYKGLIETAFTKTGADAEFKYDPEKYAEAYAKAEIKLKKALEDAKADLTVAEAKLAAAKKGEVYTPAEVKSPIVSVSQGKDGKYTVSSVDQIILAKDKTYEAYIEALGKAVTETQANVNDLNKQYEEAKKLYEEAMKQVAEYTKAK